MVEVKRVLRSPREIRKMRTAGLLVWQAHQAAAAILEPGVTTGELNEVYKKTFQDNGATPLFLNYGTPPFPAETCISVNEEVVHGIPGDRIIENGDVVSLDTGCRIDGWCGDAAVTHAIGEITETEKKLLTVTQAVLDLAIDLMNSKSMWSEIAKEMEDYVQDAGFFVVKEMVGHGIGQELHEPPQVPNYLSESLRESEDFDLRPGVVLAIEPMVNIGTERLACLEDEWTIVTQDGQASAHFEHTVAMTKDGPRRLTGPPSDEELSNLPIQFHDQSKWTRW